MNVRRFLVFATMALVLAGAGSAAAAELLVGYRAIEKTLRAQVFTSDGRKFLVGTSSAGCTHAFLDAPRVTPQGERLQVSARFHSSAGVEISGNCVGTGDEFDVWMSGVPTYRDGVLFLDQVQVQTPNKPYGDLARNLLTQTLPKILRYPLLEEVRKKAAAESQQGPYQISVSRLDVGRITLGTDQLSIPFELSLSLR